MQRYWGFLILNDLSQDWKWEFERLVNEFLYMYINWYQHYVLKPFWFIKFILLFNSWMPQFPPTDKYLQLYVKCCQQPTSILRDDGLRLSYWVSLWQVLCSLFQCGHAQDFHIRWFPTSKRLVIIGWNRIYLDNE